MALVVNGAAQLRLIWSFGGQLALNIIGVVNTNGVAIDQGLADRVGSAIKTNYSTGDLHPLLHTSTVLEKVGIRSLNSPGGFPEFQDGGAAVPGTGTGDLLPRQVACVCSLRTATATRSGRGRVYIGGFSESENVTAATISPAAQTAVANFVSVVNTALLGEQMQIGVIQRPANQIVTTTVETLPDGTTKTKTHVQQARPGVIRAMNVRFVRDAEWDTQRRRNNGRGSLTALLAPQRALDKQRTG